MEQREFEIEVGRIRPRLHHEAMRYVSDEADFGKHYGVDWNRPYSRPGHDKNDTTIEDYYPRW